MIDSIRGFFRMGPCASSWVQPDSSGRHVPQVLERGDEVVGLDDFNDYHILAEKTRREAGGLIAQHGG